MDNKNTILGVLALIVIAGGIFYLTSSSGPQPQGEQSENTESTTTVQNTNGKTVIPSVLPTPGKTTTPSTLPKTSAPTYTPSKTTGRVIFTITDEAVGLDSLQSLIATINELSVSGPAGWVAISKTPRAFDLLELHRTGKSQIFADVNLPPGAYTKMRLSLGNVIVVQKEGLKSVAAMVPAKELNMNILLTVEKEATSGISIDVLSDKALHRATDGTFIFFPAVHIAAQYKVKSVQKIGETIELFNGTSNFEQSFGTDQNGILKNGFSLSAGTRIELLGKTFRIISSDEKQNETATNAQLAIDTALKGNYLSSALSIQVVMRDGNRVWRIDGMKGSVFTNVYSSIDTGAVLASE